MAAALLALLLLSFASVQSIVMQATMPPPSDVAPVCGDRAADGMAPSMTMPGMVTDQAPAAASAPHGHRPGATHGHRAACPYCAVAAHAPITGNAAPLRHAVGFVFTAFHVVAGCGPRGPPAFQTRARDPPADPLTA